MKQLICNIITLVILLFGQLLKAGAQAQMNIIERTSEMTTLDVSKIRKITFHEGLMITDLETREEQFRMDLILGITFSAFPMSIPEYYTLQPPILHFSSINSVLEIRSLGKKDSHVLMDIYDLQGRLRASYMFEDWDPERPVIIELGLEDGYYIGLLKGDTQRCSFSFIKD
jgi:hypothetical protein